MDWSAVAPCGSLEGLAVEFVFGSDDADYFSGRKYLKELVVVGAL